MNRMPALVLGLSARGPGATGGRFHDGTFTALIPGEGGNAPHSPFRVNKK